MKALRSGFVSLISALALVALLAGSVYAGGNTIVGLWEVEGTPTGAPGPAFTNIANFSKDGIIANVDPWFGPGLGQWQHNGNGQHTVQFYHYFLSGEDVGTVTVYGTLELGPDKNSATGTFLTEFSIGGILVNTTDGTVSATRQ